MANKAYSQISRLKTLEAFQNYVESLGVEIPLVDDLRKAPELALSQPYEMADGTLIGNRFCIHPMEGWDATTEGKPTQLMTRRWQNFARSGAKLIWGCEAAAVRPDGRANPNQLMIVEENVKEIDTLYQTLLATHRENFGTTDDLVVGLQLTHSGRFCRPNQKTKLEPRIIYHHPLLDELFGISPDDPVMTDGELEDLIGDYIKAAKRAYQLGFDFVDIKHCHGYLGHELLSAVSRPGKFGGSFENRTRFLRDIVAGIQEACPGLKIGVRFSMIDFPPFRPDDENIGQMLTYEDADGKYPYAFGGDAETPSKMDLTEPVRLLALLKELGVTLVNFSAGSPYYNPHITRPAYFPPSDGYDPPEDPLVGVARHIQTAAALKQSAKDLLCVGSGYTYLQDYLPNVAEAVVDQGMIDFVGVGRMVLAYPEMPADILAGRALNRRKICRTFSDCTTAPRKGLVSGCYPLDRHYKQLPEAETLRVIKKKL